MKEISKRAAVAALAGVMAAGMLTGCGNGSGGTGGGLELSPFSLTMEFPVAVTDRKHISSTFWLTDIRNPQLVVVSCRISIFFTASSQCKHQA